MFPWQNLLNFEISVEIRNKKCLPITPFLSSVPSGFDPDCLKSLPMQKLGKKDGQTDKHTN